MSKVDRKQRGVNKEQVVLPQADFLVNMPTDYSVFIKNLKNAIGKQRIQSILKANIVQRIVAQIAWRSNISSLAQASRLCPQTKAAYLHENNIFYNNKIYFL